MRRTCCEGDERATRDASDADRFDARENRCHRWCGHCKALQPEYEKAARALEGIAKVAAVDCDAHGTLAQQHGVQGFPTIKMFSVDAKGKQQVSDYNGGRTADALVDYVLTSLKKQAKAKLGKGTSSGKGGSSSGGGFYPASSDVVTLSDDDFEEQVIQDDNVWFVEFFAPWCGHCKALKSDWMAAARQLKDKVKVGAVDCTGPGQAVCQKYGVQGFPTLKLFNKGAKSSPIDYQGGRDQASISEFALQFWVDTSGPPEVHELTDHQVFVDHCLGKEGKAKVSKCFIAFLPDILDTGASGRNEYIKTLQDAAAKYKSRSYAFFWTAAGVQNKLQTAVEVGGYGYPAFIAYAPKQNMFATHKGSVSADGLDPFFELPSGFVEVKGAFPVLDTVAAWDGLDGELPEDEFDLDELLRED